MNSVELLNQYPQLSWKDKLAYLTYQFSQLPQKACPVTHLFQDGKYIRDMFIPEGTLFIGRVHRDGHEIQLLSGEVMLLYEDHCEHKKAVDSMMTVPGYQTVFHALTDIHGRTIHPDTGERDLNKIELSIFEPVDGLLERGKAVYQELLS